MKVADFSIFRPVVVLIRADDEGGHRREFFMCIESDYISSEVSLSCDHRMIDLASSSQRGPKINDLLCCQAP